MPDSETAGNEFASKQQVLGLQAAKPNGNPLGVKSQGRVAVGWDMWAKKTPQSEHASLQLTDVFMLRLGMLLGPRWAQERGGRRHRCPAAEVGGRHTGAIAKDLPTMLHVQKGQRFPAIHQLSGWVAWLTRHSSCQHILFAKPGDNQPSYGARARLPWPLCESLSSAANGSKKRTKPTDKAILCPTCC